MQSALNKNRHVILRSKDLSVRGGEKTMLMPPIFTQQPVLVIQPDLQSVIPFSRSIHVAIISDGNGRWATSRGLSRSAGHRAGAQTARAVIEAAPRLGIHTLTLFALSSAN